MYTYGYRLAIDVGVPDTDRNQTRVPPPVLLLDVLLAAMFLTNPAQPATADGNLELVAGGVAARTATAKGTKTPLASSLS